MYFVYELVDPQTDVTGYVGITDNPNRRLKQHLSNSEANDDKRTWVEQLQSNDLKPHMKILEIVETMEEALEREKHWILNYTNLGVQLTNISHLEKKASKESSESKYLLGREYITTPQAAERSGLSKVYIAHLLKKGTLEGFQIGRDWCVYTESLQKFLDTPRKSGPKGPRKKNEGKEVSTTDNTSEET